MFEHKNKRIPIPIPQCILTISNVPESDTIQTDLLLLCHVSIIPKRPSQNLH